MTSLQEWVREEFYGHPQRSMRRLNLAFGLGVGLLTRSPGWGLAAALLGAGVWDRFSPHMLITDQRLGPLTLRVPARDGAGVKRVWLTFDDGPGPETDAVLDILQQYEASATFFVIGERVANCGGRAHLAERFAAGGHAVGHHSWSHPSFLGLRAGQVWDELARADELLRKSFPASWRPIFRPPFGYRTADLFTHLKTLGLHTVGWSLNSLDFLAGDSERLSQRVLQQTDPGAILLFHDGPSKRARTVQALPAILAGLRSQGYSFAVPGPEDFPL